jgi:hypothetical protein
VIGCNEKEVIPVSNLFASRGTTKVCAGCHLIVPTDKDGPIPREVQCSCNPEGRKTSWQFSDSFDSFSHADDCGCTRCVEKREWRLAERSAGIEDANAGRPASKINIWYLDGYTSRKFCSTCRQPLNTPGDASSEDCGGDCVRCMAAFGDPDCIRSMAEFEASRQVV